jgi:nicotinate-nucleotide--dimethylbenzimidazole phosphoribosyltransferase
VSVFARQQGLQLSVVDCGVAEPAATRAPAAAQDRPRHAQCPRHMAMSLDQAHAAIRAGMEIADSLRGNVIACAGLGVGSHESAALVLSRLTDTPVRELMVSGPTCRADLLAH